MAFNYDHYLRTQKLPTLWCYGCGDGVILKAMIRAIDKLGWSMDDVCVVSGIGCSGRMSSYVDCNTVHTTHGRALAFATGVKLTHPEKHVIVVTGDGDGLAIGGNHTIHAARRNIGLKHILVNNFIYGLTNSQTSPTTPQGMWSSTAQYGNVDPTFNACDLAIGAGASFVGRESVTEPVKLAKLFFDGFKHNGYAFFDVFSNCHTNLGRKNKMADVSVSLDWLKSRLVSKAAYEKLEDKNDMLPTGILSRHEREEYTDMYKKVIVAAQNSTRVKL